MAQLYNNAIEHAVEVGLQELYKSNMDMKTYIAQCLDTYIYTGVKTKPADFEKHARKLFSFEEYGKQAFTDQNNVNVKGLAQQFEAQGIKQQYKPRLTLNNLEQFKQAYSEQLTKYITAGYAQLTRNMQEFDKRMAEAVANGSSAATK